MNKVFLDTNILVYAQDARAPDKRAKARFLLAKIKSQSIPAVISTQILQEFYNTLVRKLGVTPADAISELHIACELETVSMTSEIVLAAAGLHSSASLSFWDALIIAAAQAANCDEVWTEDLQHGRQFGRLRVMNPFASA